MNNQTRIFLQAGRCKKVITCPSNYGKFREDLRLLICRPHGRLTSNMIADILTCRDCLAGAQQLHVNRYHDLTKVAGVDLRFSEMSALAEMEHQARGGQSPVKACYLVANEVVFGMVRMYQALAEKSGVEVHVSYDLSELATILNVSESELIP